MIPVTNSDLFILITVAACIHIGVLGYAIMAAREGQRMVAEAQRLTKAVAALVIQESEETRQLFER